MEESLRLQLLRALIRDRSFLKNSRHNLDPTSFPTKEEQIIAAVSSKFYDTHEDPIGGLVRHYAEDSASENGLGADAKKRIKTILDTVLGATLEPVSVRALEDVVKRLKHSSFYENAIDEIITAHEKKELSAHTLEALVERANRELNAGKVAASDYFAELEQRMLRREHFSDGKKFPLLLIDPLDEQIKAIGRGHTGLWLAPYSSGKGMALVHLDIAYALQSLNVLHITLEDPREEVEDRLDAALSGLAKEKLVNLPNKLRNRFAKMKKKIHGRIRIVDGTAEEWTVTKVERTWEQLCQEGFVADVVVVDYDDYIKCERQFKGEGNKRFEMEEIYKRFNRFAAKRDIIFWTAAQTGRGAEGKKIVTGKDAAEDINKIRKVFFAIGIGTSGDTEGLKYLTVCRHRLDRSRFTVEIMSDFASATFYDRDATLAYQKGI
jgi:hypothetical protein